MIHDDDIERVLKDEMDLDTFRDKVIALIWRDDMEGLRRLCKQQIMLPIILEKVINEIAPGNRWNDVLFLMARWLIEADRALEYQTEDLEEKKHLVGNPSGGREILRPFVREELSPTEFMKRLQLVMGTHTLMGLDALVGENPNTTRNFIHQLLEQHGGKLDPATRLFQMLCEMGVAYRNHHQRSDLLDLLQRAGGRLNLLTSAEDIGSIRVIEGGDVLHDLEEEARLARETLLSGDPDKALALYEEVLPKMDTVFARMTPMTGEYANVLLFSSVLLALKGDASLAQQRLLKCMQKRFAFGLHSYAALLLTNVHLLQENADKIRNAFQKVDRDVASYLAFDCFFQHASGHSFSELNELYDRFLEAAGDREMEKASALSEQILGLCEAKRNSIVPHSLCEFMARLFRACHFALQEDMARAEREYNGAYHGEVPASDLRRGFERMAADPQKLLSHYFPD